MVCLNRHRRSGLSPVSKTIEPARRGDLAWRGDVAAPWPIERNRIVAANLASFCLQALALITWSWTSGFALRKLSRSTIWVSGMAFLAIYLVVLASDGWFPVAISWAWLAFSISFLFVLLPAYCGLRQSAGFVSRKFPWMVLLALWTVTISGLALWTWDWYQAAMDNWSRGAPPLTLWQLAQRADSWRVGSTHMLAAAVLTAPVGYVFAKDLSMRKGA